MIDEGDSGSLIVDEEDSVSLIVDEGKSDSLVVDQEDSVSLIVDEGKSGSLVVVQEDSVSLIVDQGESCSLVVDQEDSGTAISGPPGSKLSKGPLVEGTSQAPYMHKFSRGSRACSPRTFLNLDSLKYHFPEFGERFYRILMVRKRHCNISEALLANVFAL